MAASVRARGILTGSRMSLRWNLDRPNARRPPRPKVHLVYLGELANLAAYVVDGEKVRDTLDVDFTMGGHPARYGYIPDREVWIEIPVSTREAALTLLHEVVEYRLMHDLGWTYDKAHDEAAAVERVARKLMSEAVLHRAQIVPIAKDLFSRIERP